MSPAFDRLRHPRAPRGASGGHGGQFVHAVLPGAPTEPDALPPSGLLVAPTEEREWHELGVHAPAFNRWFGDFETDAAGASKVTTTYGFVPAIPGDPRQVFPNAAALPGSPLVVFHGTGLGTFRAFDLGHADPHALFGRGFYFTEDLEVGRSYQERAYRYEMDAPIGASSLEQLRDHVDELYNDAPSYHQAELGAFRRALHSGEPEMAVAHLTDPAHALSRIFAARLGVMVHKVQYPALLRCFLSIRKPLDLDRPLTVPVALAIGEAIKEWAVSTTPIRNKQGYQNEPADWLYATAFDNTAGPEHPGQIHTPVSVEEALVRALGACRFPGQRVGGDNESTRRIGTIARAAGFDGLTHLGGGRVGWGDSTRQHRVWIAFEPTQIKSAANSGTFDPENPDIYKAL